MTTRVEILTAAGISEAHAEEILTACDEQAGEEAKIDANDLTWAQQVARDLEARDAQAEAA